MKQAWQELDRRLKALEEKNEQLTDWLRSGKRRTALERLVTDYKRFTALGGAFILMGVWLFGFSQLYGEYHRWLMGVYIALLLVFSLESYWFYRKLSGIDVVTMDVGQVNRMVLHYRKCNLRLVILQAPLAFVFVGAMIALNTDDVYMVCGIVTGAVVGLAFGLRTLLRRLADYKVLASEE